MGKKKHSLVHPQTKSHLEHTLHLKYGCYGWSRLVVIQTSNKDSKKELRCICISQTNSAHFRNYKFT